MLLEEGTYQIVVTDHKLAKSKDRETPSVKIVVKTEFNINDVEKPIVETIYHDLYLTEKTFDRTMESLRVLGWEGCDLSELNNTGCIVGNKAWATVYIEEYKGKERNKIGFINEVGAGPSIKPLESNDVKDICEKFNWQIKKECKGLEEDNPLAL